jgi:hypothetical protein
MGESEESSPNSVLPDVTVRFIVPYETNWGEYILLSGNRGLLGAGSTYNGLKMSCRAGERGLEWETSVVIPDQYECEYFYSVYNEHSDKLVLKECAKHSLKVPASVAGSTIILADNFQVPVHPDLQQLKDHRNLFLLTDRLRCMQKLSNIENIYKSTAFKDVILGCGSQMTQPLQQPAVKGPGRTTIRFSVMCVRIPRLVCS